MAKLTPDFDSALQNLSPGQVNEVEMHSFCNLVNIIHAQIELLVDENEVNASVEEALHLTRELASETRKGNVSIFSPEHFREYKNMLQRTLHSLEDDTSDDVRLDEIREARNLLDSIFTVLDARLKELCERISDPGSWHVVDIDLLRSEYDAYFRTQEKNSKGRFRIARSPADKGANDYLVQVEITSDRDNTLSMPLLFKDVIRDLVSNARKYTPAGGIIHMQIRQNNGLLRVSISDNGIGIPEEELPMVFDYGYRASNAERIRTMGGGFGLTKALHVVRLFNGNIRIESTPGKGTAITAELPLPE